MPHVLWWCLNPFREVMEGAPGGGRGVSSACARGRARLPRAIHHIGSPTRAMQCSCTRVCGLCRCITRSGSAGKRRRRLAQRRHRAVGRRSARARSTTVRESCPLLHMQLARHHTAARGTTPMWDTHVAHTQPLRERSAQGAYYPPNVKEYLPSCVLTSCAIAIRLQAMTTSIMIISSRLANSSTSGTRCLQSLARARSVRW